MLRSTISKPTSPAPMAAKPERLAGWVKDSGNQALMATLVFLLFLRVVIPGFFDYGHDEHQGENDGFATNQLVWLSLLFIPLVLLRARLKLAWSLIRSLNGFSVALTVYACASILWSIDPGATERKLFHLLTMYLVCAAACLIGWHPRRFQEVLRPILTILLVGSLIFGLVRPDLAISAPDLSLGETAYYWRGLANQKNGLGSLASFGLIFWFHAWISKETKSIYALCGIAASAACLYLSGSSTSLLATSFTMLVLLAVRFMPRGLRPYMPYVIAVVAAGIMCYGLAVLKLVPGLDSLVSSITSSVGKDTTFTGRTGIWNLVKEHIQLSPVFGSGYGAFWTGPVVSSASYVFLKRLFFYPWESHEGYLEIVNDLGYVGLALLLGLIATYLSLSFRLLKIDRSQASLYIGLLLYELLANLAESTWLTVGPSWLIIAFAIIALSRELLDRRLRATLRNPTASAAASEPGADDRPFATRSQLRSSSGRRGPD